MGKYNTECKHKEGQEMYKAVYHFILKYYRKHHYMPSTRNIADGLDISMATPNVSNKSFLKRLKMPESLQWSMMIRYIRRQD